MKREYDFQALARGQSFTSESMEKVCRIADLLEDVSAIKFLSERLSLYGGTALTFIHSHEIPRLSIDLDFNYRHVNAAEWGQTRTEIDARLKDLLNRQGYKKEDIAINASYPLTRFTVKYLNSKTSEDTIKIEIGYLRRTPILKTDMQANFRHIGTQDSFKTTTPNKEELFANKWCTMLYRRTARDVFDTSRIADMEFDRDTFRKCAIIDSLTRKKPKLHEIDPETTRRIPLDSSLRNLLQPDKLPSIDFNKIKERATEFTRTQIQNITNSEREMINQFWEQKTYNPGRIDPNHIFHDKIAEYPAALWTIEKLREAPPKSLH